jgi:hypothetical protein
MKKYKIPKVQFGGERHPLTIGTIALQCYILENHKRVFDREFVGRSMGFNGRSQNWLYDFMSHINRFSPLPVPFLDALAADQLFEAVDINGASVLKKSISPALLIQCCKFIVQANHAGHLYLSEVKFAKAAEKILEQEAEMDKRIDFASGYERYKANHLEALVKYMRRHATEGALHWVKSIPEPFLIKFLEFYDLDWASLNKIPKDAAAPLMDLVFCRIPSNLLEELRTSKPKMKYKKTYELEQYLVHPKLNEHLLVVAALMKASGGNKAIFSQLLDKTLPPINAYEINWTQENATTSTNPALANLEESLRKAVRKPLKNSKK